jgi:ATP-dependent helicase STH1/SNF2
MLRKAKTARAAELNLCAWKGKGCCKLCAPGPDQDWVLELGRAVQMYYANTEKVAKHIERISKECLKADDDEAYMKQIDTAKYTRITHLLRQTDSYLDSLAQAVHG